MAINKTRITIDMLKENYVFRFNIGNKKVEFYKVGEDASFREMTDIDFNSIKVEIALKDNPCSKENLKSIIYSNQWEIFDPYLDFLKELPLWDGQDHIANLAATVRTDDDEFWIWC